MVNYDLVKYVYPAILLVLPGSTTLFKINMNSLSVQMIGKKILSNQLLRVTHCKLGRLSKLCYSSENGVSNQSFVQYAFVVT